MHCNLEGISKRFGKDWVLKDIHLQIIEGSHTAVLGSNGSGKSTLLRIIAGQLGQSKGNIIYSIKGRPIIVDHVFKHLSFVAPYIDVYKQLTFTELSDFHFSLRAIRPETSIKDVLESINVPKKTPLSSFSSGMLQRVKLALAFHTDSKLMLFDEPTMNLDKEGAAWFLEKLHDLPKDITVVVASNVPDKETSTCSILYKIEGSQVMVT